MKPIKSITAATDFSQGAMRSVHRAALLASVLPARLELLRIGSVTRHVLAESHCDILVARRGNS